MRCTQIVSKIALHFLKICAILISHSIIAGMYPGPGAERECIMRKRAPKEKRFQKIYSQGAGSVEIWVDKETGVNYLYHASGYAGGLTVLLDKDGKPVVTPIEEE